MVYATTTWHERSLGGIMLNEEFFVKDFSSVCFLLLTVKDIYILQDHEKDLNEG